MKALLWKDWRLVRPLLIAAGVLYLSPTVIYAAAAPFRGPSIPTTIEEWFSGAALMCTLGLFASLLACPMFSAVMFAKERRERTAELTATLPVPRARVVASKAIICLAAAALPWIVTVLAAGVLGLRAGGVMVVQFPTELGLHFVLVPLSFTLMSMGLGWLFSALFQSETLAAGLAVLLTAMGALAIALVINRMNYNYELGTIPYYSVALTTATITALAGTITALRRGTP